MTTNTPVFPTSGLTILDQAPAALKANPRNARTHSKKQIAKIADSIRAFGFTVPLVVDDTGLVLAGHGRLMAAKQLGLPTVPTVRLDHLSDTQKRAYAIADNKIANLAGWDRATLSLELGELAIHLPEIGLDLSITGFEIAELDLLTGDLDEERLASREDEQHEPEAPVSQLGDLWQLGPHRILCGSA
ncbi:ParB/Srx family N-terminal domain-containing protein [Methylobacterium sp. E-045]|uniref:ParB/Srx family N-terminal domain-containing protein n=1 Tax=Methylobacterium sp. E-045 TaxID=2836575 RepID=UPI0028BD3558|nr:ParB/Srx family N-terminal domain-containing protein [Methylobacterium sp. E-045]